MKQLLRPQTVGWFCMTVAGLFMSNQYLSGEPFNMVASLIFLIGAIMVMNQSSFFALSDSSMKVRREVRSQQAGRSYHVHKRHISYALEDPYSLLHVCALLVVIVAIVVPTQYWLGGVFIATALVWQMYAVARRNQRDAFWGQVFFYLVMLTWAAQGTGTTMARLNDISMETEYRAMVGVATIMFTFGSALFPILERRDGMRPWVRNQVIALTAGFSTVMYMVLYPFTASLWITSLLMLGAWYFIIAAFSWLRHKEYSYAKYYALVGSIIMFFGAFYVEKPIYTGILFFGLTVIVFAAGFTVPSYTARSVGMAAAAMFVAMYVLSISPTQWMYGHEEAAAGLGIVSAAFMLTLSRWYGDLPKTSQEHLYVTTIQNAYAAASALVLISVIGNSALTRAQMIPLGVLLGLGTAYLGKRWQLPLIRIVGIAMAVVYVLSISFVL